MFIVILDHDNICRCHFCDITVHNKKVIEEIRILDTANFANWHCAILANL